LELLRSLCSLAAAVRSRPAPERRPLRSPAFGDPPECSEPDVLSLIQVSANASSERAGLLRGERYVSSLQNFGTEYVMDLTIAGQKLHAIPDTGSFDIVIPQASALSCKEPSCAIDSSGKEVYLEYGSGKVWAHNAKADVSVGPLASSDQSFLIGYKTSIESAETFAVVAGIGPPAGGHELLVQLGVQYVSACLPLQGSGKLIWNDAPRGTAIPLAGQHHWGVQMTAVQLEGPGGTHPVGCNGGCAAIMDTGTSLISAPSSVIAEIEKGLNKLGGDCDSIDQVASLKFKLGGHDVELPAEAFVGYVSDGWNVECDILIMDSGEIDTNMGHLWILGMPFFSAYHTTFDLGSPGGMDKANMRIHLAPTGGSCGPSRTSDADRKLRKIDWKKVRRPAWLRSAKEKAAKEKALGGGNVTFAL